MLFQQKQTNFLESFTCICEKLIESRICKQFICDSNKSIETANILALSALGIVSLNMKRVIETAVGHAHGPNGLIKRIVSPSDLGQIIKPFVFLQRYKPIMSA